MLAAGLLAVVLALSLGQSEFAGGWRSRLGLGWLEPARYQPLADRLGPPLYSKQGEELMIRDWFDDRRDGFFLDVGASHYQINSNTFYLEKHLGWRGIAVDALAEYEPEYLTYRPATLFFTFFVSDRSDERAPFFVHSVNRRLSTGSGSLAEAWDDQDLDIPAPEGWDHEQIEVPTITLNDLLDHAGVARIDLLSMDIEMWEPQALAGFDIRRFAPQLVCIEAHPEVRDAISAYFADAGYQRIEKYLAYDSGNWYFRPQG